MKHVEVNRHFIKEKLEEGTICMMYIPSTQQAADLLTKTLAKPAFEKLQDKLGLLNIFVPASGGVVEIFSDNGEYLNQMRKFELIQTIQTALDI